MTRLPVTGSFDPKLPVELAMGMTTPQEVCESYGVTTKAALQDLADNAVFRSLYEWALEVRAEPNGLFRLQMMMLSDNIVASVYAAMTDEDSPPTIRLRAAELAAKLAGLEPVKKVDTQAAEKFTINIVLP